jgi:ABC-type transporter Mla maintaining outer membrane lipid asymmetry ATPase subunit MlaF
VTAPAPAAGSQDGGTPMIALRGLSKAFGSKVALRQVNLSVAQANRSLFSGRTARARPP